MTSSSVPSVTPHEHGVLRAPGSLIFGDGSRYQIATQAARFGASANVVRVGVIVDPFLEPSPAFTGVLAELTAAEITYRVFSDVIPELPTDSIDRAATAFAGAFDGTGPDVLLAYGGGSAIDLAKLVTVRLATDRPLAEFYGENRVDVPVTPVIAVPTTAGTGSEVTPVAVVSDPTHALKVGVSDPALIPAVALVDPELTVGMPPSVTAYSGIDALAHAIESFTARVTAPSWETTLPVSVGANRLSSSLALEATTALGGSLVDAYRDGTNLPARRNNAYGATLAGFAFGNAGVHIGHAIQYPLGALTNTPHGMGTGLLLPYVMEACLPYRVEELAQIADALTSGAELPATGTSEARAVLGIRRVADICRAIGLPSSLHEMGVRETHLADITEKSIGITRLMKNAPFDVDHDSIYAVVRRAYEGAVV